MRDLERLRAILEREMQEAAKRQMPGNSNRPSGFMNGLTCALRHIDGLISQDKEKERVVSVVVTIDGEEYKYASTRSKPVFDQDK